MGRATLFVLASPPGEGLKGQISFNFNYKVNFKDFYSKLCVCSRKLCSLGHAPGVGIRGARGAQVVKKSNCQTWSCGISNRRG